jgi:hypothetical protein
MPVFDNIRFPELEREANFKVNVNIDALGTFDYENGQDRLYPSRKQYMKLIANEVKLLKLD